MCRFMFIVQGLCFFAGASGSAIKKGRISATSQATIQTSRIFVSNQKSLPATATVCCKLSIRE